MEALFNHLDVTDTYVAKYLAGFANSSDYVHAQFSDAEKQTLRSCLDETCHDDGKLVALLNKFDV